MKTIILYQDKGVMFVDDEDYDTLAPHTWVLTAHGYARASMGDGRHIFAHNLILGGRIGDTDHVNGNKLDNQRFNLRFVTRGQNVQNGIKSTNKSGFIGVSWDKKGNKWRAQINFGGKVICLIRTTDKLLAAQTYDNAAIKYFGSEALTNQKAGRYEISV